MKLLDFYTLNCFEMYACLTTSILSNENKTLVEGVLLFDSDLFQFLDFVENLIYFQL